MKIIIINGPCGVGKSSIAEKLHKNKPHSFLLDIDSLRRLFSRYQEERDESRTSSLKLSESIVNTCLDMGYDVIIDKMQYDTKVLDAYYGIAKQKGSEVREIILWASKSVVMERANIRGWKDSGSLTPEKCEAFWDQIDAMKDTRPNAVIIDTSDISLEESYIQVERSVA